MAEILRAWDPDLSVLIGCAALLAAYGYAHRGDFSRAKWFVAGVAVMLFAIIVNVETLWRKRRCQFRAYRIGDRHQNRVPH